MLYTFLKALHIVGFVSWFAGIFYLVRLFIYHTEAQTRSTQEYQVLHPQFSLMEKRLYSIIMHPAMLITVVCGIGMLILNPSWLRMGWMHLKLTLMVGLIAYHFWCRQIMHRLWREDYRYSSFRLRLINEIPTLFLLAIVMLATYKNLENAGWGLLGLVAFGFLLFMGARIYKGRREKQGQQAMPQAGAPGEEAGQASTPSGGQPRT
jgi:putative membrane protein